MRRQSRILNYFPRQFQDRLRAVFKVEYDLRQEEKCQTRIKMGYSDLELFKKIKGSGRWIKVNLPKSLPNIDMNPSSSLGSPLSPAPGTPGKDRNQDDTLTDSMDSEESEKQR